MAAWGTNIFDSDYALDLKTDFIEMLGVGYSISEIETCFLNNAPKENDEEECIFWSVIALLEWEYGISNLDIKDKAKYIIKNRPDDILFINDKDRNKRRIELEKIYKKLDTINPKVKKKKKTFVYRTPWNLGDIYALEINGKYIYIHIVGIQRKNKRIKRLSTDQVFIKVFDIVSNELLSIKAFHKKIFGLKYRNLNGSKRTHNYIERIWCMSEREQKNFEKRIIYIGNKKNKRFLYV